MGVERAAAAVWNSVKSVGKAGPKVDLMKDPIGSVVDKGTHMTAQAVFELVHLPAQGAWAVLDWTRKKVFGLIGDTAKLGGTALMSLPVVPGVGRKAA